MCVNRVLGLSETGLVHVNCDTGDDLSCLTTIDGTELQFAYRYGYDNDALRRNARGIGFYGILN